MLPDYRADSVLYCVNLHVNRRLRKACSPSSANSHKATKTTFAKLLVFLANA